MAISTRPYRTFTRKYERTCTIFEPCNDGHFSIVSIHFANKPPVLSFLKYHKTEYLHGAKFSRFCLKIIYQYFKALPAVYLMCA